MQELENTKDSLIYQSNKLIEASYRLRIGQQKFLRLMASKINKNDEDFKEYEFRIADVMELFENKSQKSYTEITKQLKELMGNVLTFKYGKTTTLVPFLAFAQQDEGSGIVKVMFHPFLKPMYLSLNKENPFTIYELSNALKLRSTYSLRFYELLKQYEKIGYRTLSVLEIRELFELQPQEYSRYNDFKRKIILQAQKEINEKTDISFDFEEIKTGRKVTSIKFLIKSNKKVKAPKEKAPINEVSVDVDNNISKLVELMKDNKITYGEAESIYKSGNADLMHIVEVYEHFKNKQANNFVGLMIDQVKPGVFNKPKQNQNKTSFNNFEPREYDYESLEKKLLGWEDETDLNGEEYEQLTVKE